MSKEQFKRKNAFIGHGILDELEDLTESEQLELLKALLIHSRDNTDPQFNDRLMRNIYNRYAKADDENKESYLETCEKRRLAALEREEKKRQEQEEKAQEAQQTTKSAIVHKDRNELQQGTIATDKEKEKDKDILKEKDPKGSKKKSGEPLSFPAPELDEIEENEALRAKTAEWLEYKAERREKYKPTGLKSLITQIKNNADRYGAEAVCTVISSSMSSGYKGIMWDSLKRINSPPQYGKPDAKPSFAQREFDEEAERQKRIAAMFSESAKSAGSGQPCG